MILQAVGTSWMGSCQTQWVAKLIEAHQLQHHGSMGSGGVLGHVAASL